MLSTLSFTTRSLLGLQRKTKNSAHGRGQQIWMRCQIISVEPCLTDLDWVMVTKGGWGRGPRVRTAINSRWRILSRSNLSSLSSWRRTRRSHASDCDVTGRECFFEISYILANTQIQGSPSLKKTTLYILFVAIVLKFDSSRSIPTALRMVLIRTEGQGI